jgi:hypothetical protein
MLRYYCLCYHCSQAFWEQWNRSSPLIPSTFVDTHVIDHSPRPIPRALVLVSTAYACVTVWTRHSLSGRLRSGSSHSRHRSRILEPSTVNTPRLPRPDAPCPGAYEYLMQLFGALVWMEIVPGRVTAGAKFAILPSVVVRLARFDRSACVEVVRQCHCECGSCGGVSWLGGGERVSHTPSDGGGCEMSSKYAGQWCIVMGYTAVSICMQGGMSVQLSWKGGVVSQWN